MPNIDNSLSAHPEFERLADLLQELGIDVVRAEPGPRTGFPLVLPVSGGDQIVLELASPPLLSQFDPDTWGAAVIDATGLCVASWGLAKLSQVLHGSGTVFDTELGQYVRSAFNGVTSTVYLDGFRFSLARVESAGVAKVLVLAMDARDEQRARLQAHMSQRSAETMRRLGKALTMNQTLQPMCTAAVYEIMASVELSAVLLWVQRAEGPKLELVASVGANRAGMAALAAIDPTDGCTCIAELAAGKRTELAERDVFQNLMTSELEAKFCYLKPGGLLVLPLIINDKLIGVLELIGRAGDTTLFDQRDLFVTIAEHLALALNSALLFEGVERLATYDPLTGIANHRAMQDFLQRRLAEAERHGEELGVIMIDVDHFRSFNEEEGHDAGDAVLKMVVGVLADSIRPYDLAARYGGEEFTVIMPTLGLDGTMRVAERIREKIERLEYVTASGRTRHVSASLGCAVFPGTARDSASLLRAADQALFQAKRNGRNRVEVYQGEFTPDSSEGEDTLGPAIAEVLSVEELSEGEEVLGYATPILYHLARELRLSLAQQRLLQGLLQLAGPYAESEVGDKSFAKKIEAIPAFRAVVPSLKALGERFDGTGPQGLAGARIPLLARVASVILSLKADGGQGISSDPARFDPEIVAVATDLDEAA